MLDTALFSNPDAFKDADALARELSGTGARPHEVFGHLIAIAFAATVATAYQDGDAMDYAESTLEDALKSLDRSGIDKARAASMTNSLVMALSENGGDRLGDMAARLGILHTGLGQFFTPSCVATLLSRIQVGSTDFARVIAEKGYVSAMDPTAGSGGLLIQFAKKLRDAGYDPKFKLFCEATEIDVSAFRMLYVQLSAYDIPARVVLGDSLTRENRMVLFTPAYIKFFFPRRQVAALMGT